MKVEELTAHSVRDKLQSREISAEELTQALLEYIEKVEPQIKAYLFLNKENALRQAKEFDQRLAKGEKVPIFGGIPIAIKDNICTKGIPTTCASKILANYIPIYNATVVERLLQESAIVLGKTNLDEFAMGSSTENSAFAVTTNPWDVSRVPGGSSGGSAAAVAAGEAIWALGSDTGGSIRQPASLCGIVGFKPTYGLVSRYGLVAFASSLDQIGPLTKDVTDSAHLLQIVSGHDPQDSTSLKYDPPRYADFLGKDIKGIKVAVVKELFGEGFQSEVRAAISQSLKILENLGAVVEEISLPTLEYALSAYYIIAPAEASSNLARFDGVRYGYRSKITEDMVEMYKHTRAEGFGSEVKRRIMLGTYALSAGYYEAYYGQAQKVRTLIIEDFKNAFAKYEVLVSPTAPTVAFKIGEKVAEPLQMYLSDICTIPANLAGIPSISIPCGFGDGLPIGLQIMGKHFDEGAILKVAYATEQELKIKAKPKDLN